MTDKDSFRYVKKVTYYKVKNNVQWPSEGSYSEKNGLQTEE